MDAFGFTVARVDEIPDEEISPGIRRKALLAAGPVSAFLYTFAPGVSVGKDLHHRIEVGYVRSGMLQDEHRIYPGGTLFVAEAGSFHYPFAPRGAEVLILEFDAGA